MIKLAVFVIASVALASGAPRVSSSVPLIDGRIVGGEPAEIANYPYQISLQYFGSHMCGGSLIAESWIVTAAHCTDGFSASLLTVRAGSSLRGSGGQVASVSKIYMHPNYNRNTIDYDIAILELSSPIAIAYAEPIQLPAADAPIPEGLNAVITGWGTTSEGGSLPTQLQVVTVPTVSPVTCRAAYGNAAITDRMLCAGLVEGGKDACQGDSGGPLAIDGLLVGIVSWGYGCARPNYPGVYTSVPSVRGFIQEITNL